MVVQVLCLWLGGIVAFEYDMVPANNNIKKRLEELLIHLLFHEKGPLPKHTSVAHLPYNAKA